MLELQNLTKVYKTKSEDVVALNKVNLTFGETGMVFVTGKSGSGKTTLLNVVGGLDSFDGGDLIIKGKSFADFKQHDFDDYRNTFVGFVFQEYNLLDEMTVEKNISLAMELQGAKKRDVAKINKILEQVDLSGLNKRQPNELSGGQKQRVAIARALVKDPKIILTDEPTGALDTNSGVQVMNVLKELSKERLVIIVSHNIELAKAYADRIVEMKDGEIVRDYTLTRDEQSKKLRLKEMPEKVIVRRGAKLTDADLKVLQSAVEHEKEIQLVDENNFFFEKDTENVETKQYSPEDAKFIKGRLGIVNNLSLGLSNLKIKPVRLIVTILLCAIAFSVFGLFDTLSVYDEARLTANTLRNSNVPSIVMTSSMLEENGKEYNFNLSQELVDQLGEDTGLHFKGVYEISPIKPDETRSIANISKYYTTTRMSGVVEIADENELSALGMSLKEGKLPEQYDEIAISSYYAWCIINWGYQGANLAINADNCNEMQPSDLIKEDPIVLTFNQKSYKIVGIIDVGALDEKYDGILEDYASASQSLINEFENYVANSFNLYGFVKEGFVDNTYVLGKTPLQYKNPAYEYEFDAIDITNAQYFFNYKQLSEVGGLMMFIDPNRNVEQNPLAGNEILINVLMFEQVYASQLTDFRNTAEMDKKNGASYLGSLDDDEVGYLARLKTTETAPADKLGIAREIITLLCKSGYPGSVPKLQLKTNATKRDTNQYDAENSLEYAKVELENKEYKIVGFYTGLAQTVSTSALVLTEDGIANLGVNTQQGSYSSVIAPSSKSNAVINEIVSLVKRDSGLKFTSSNNVISIITLNKEALQDMSTLFLIASGVFAVFAIAMMANYISTTINSRHTQIGILRALGTTGFDVLLIFLVESLLIAIINIVLSNVITAVSCIFLNNYFEKVINVSIPLATYTIRQFWVIFGVSLGVALLASIAPIAKLSRKKPIETIRR